VAAAAVAIACYATNACQGIANALSQAFTDNGDDANTATTSVAEYCPRCQATATRSEVMAEADAFAGIPLDGAGADLIRWSNFNPPYGRSFKEGPVWADFRRLYNSPYYGYSYNGAWVKEHPFGHPDEPGGGKSRLPALPGTVQEKKRSSLTDPARHEEVKMEDSSQNDPRLRTGTALRESWANIWADLPVALHDLGEIDVATQLERVMVPLQNLKGSENEFSFMAFPVPRLTREQLEKIALRDERSIIVRIRNGRIQIEVDDFGQSNWFYVFGLPELYHSLRKSIADLA
jgi:hypothetical protein